MRRHPRLTFRLDVRSHELSYALTTVGCRAIVCATSHKTSDYLAILSELVPEFATATPGSLRSRSLPDLSIVIQIGGPAHRAAIPFEDLLTVRDEAKTALAEAVSGVGFGGPTNIQFTSGTTGAPKGAPLTHHNILNNGIFVGDALFAFFKFLFKTSI